jgi:hypothetical protein
LFILVSVILGVIIGMLVILPGTIRHRFEVRNHRRRIGDLEKSLDEQKVQSSKSRKVEPLTDSPEDDQL